MTDQLLQELMQLIYKVGDEILKFYRFIEDIEIENKANNTPVTDADKIAHDIIFQTLQQLTPEIPILSEEGKSIAYAQRQKWSEYWLIDPLDGTKEFINKTDDFSVNIALIKKNKPVLGLVYAPVTNILYYATEGEAYKIEAHGIPERINTVEITAPIRIAVSRHHQGDKLKAFLSNISNYELVIMGSALKLCIVAEAKADIYLRLGPTSEWDTGAGQYVLECAGGAVLDLQGEPLQYNTKDSLLNPAFLALGDTNFPWQNYLKEILEK